MGALAKFPNPKKLAPSTLKQQMLKRLVCSDAPEQALRYRGFRMIAGVDEVGRGALFGPVVAAAVILPERISSLAAAGLTDSKQLVREDRERLDKQIRRMALSVCVGVVDAETIDRINIYQATRTAMLTAINGLSIAPDHLLIDAMVVDHPCPQTKLFYGDSLSLSIAAASVVAKVFRDAMMCELDAIEHGPCALHRRSFAPVRAVDPNAVQPVEDHPAESLFNDFELETATPEATAWA